MEVSLSLIVSVVALLASSGQSLAGPAPRLLRYPTVHGDTVVFSYAGDLWSANIDSSGIARRLTSSPGPEIRPRFSPDGSTIAFTATYDGSPDLYTIPVEGGEPTRVTFDGDVANCLGWTPDGKIAYASIMGSYSNRQPRLWLADPKGGLPIRTVLEEATDVSYFANGRKVAYERQSSFNFNWRHYRGGSQGKISLYDFDSNAYSELPIHNEQAYYPMVVGSSVYYVSDRAENSLNLYRYNVDTKKDLQLTHFTDADIRFPNTDGKTIVWERDGYLWDYDIATGSTKQIKPTILADLTSIRPNVKRLGDQITAITLSPTGSRVAVEARGNLFSVPAHTGETRSLYGKPGARGRFPSWSPDGKTIAYVSDESGEYQVYVQPQMGGPATKLTDFAKTTIQGIGWAPDSKNLLVYTTDNDFDLVDVATKKLTTVFRSDYGIKGLDFSADGKWIAYSNAGPTGFGAISLYEIATGKATKISDGQYDDQDVAFDTSGKFLYFVSLRTFNPTAGAYEDSLKVENGQQIYVLPLAKDEKNPLVAAGDEEPAGGAPKVDKKPSATSKIDFSDIADRALPLPLLAGAYSGLQGVDGGVLYDSGGTLFRFDLAAKTPTPLGGGFLGPRAFNASKTKMAYVSGGMVGIVDLHPGIAPGQGRVDTSAVEAIIDPRQEWKQIFWEAWRFQRDHFYDPNFVGLDIDALGKRYASYLPSLSHRADLNYILGLMVGEFGTSHSYVGGGDMGMGNPPLPVGRLGVDYAVEGNYVRIAKIYRGMNFDEADRGPLGEPGVDVKDGDYLLAIDGKPLTAKTAPGSLLLDKVGKTVVLTVNGSPTMAGARRVDVRPISSESNLRYVEWVEDNRRKVDKLSGGRIGYMHIPNTSEAGMIGLIKGFYSQTDKDAVIVDERFNGGGNIQPWFVDTLARKIRVGIQQRHGADGSDAVAIEGPKAMLINGYAGSGGDFFPYMFRQSKLGPLIGKRTWGGLVGIGAGAPLVDGGFVNTPEFSLFNRDTNEIVAENRGVTPDIDVDQRPDLVAKGHDPQLETAVQYLLDQLKKNPPRPKRTKQPKPKQGDWTGGG